jgi:hypothetical protein
VALSRAAQTPRWLAEALLVQGMAAVWRGDLDRARAYVEEGIASKRALGDTMGLSRGLVCLGSVLCRQDRASEAGTPAREALALSHAAGDYLSVQVSLILLAQVAQAQGQPAHAARLLGMARSVAMRQGQADVTGHPYDPAGYERLKQDVRAALGAQAEAAARAEGESVPWADIVITALQGPP